MKKLVKPAIVLGIAGALALGSITASQARARSWAAGAAGFAVGAAVGATAANAGNGYYYNNGSGYYDDSYAYAHDRPGGAYTGDPAYAGYNAYGYAPGYNNYGYDGSTRSWPPHRDPGYGYNSNTVSPWQDRRLQGKDY